MKTLFFIAAAAVVSICFWLSAQTSGTADYIPSRFVLMQGSLSVSNTVNSGALNNNIQQCILKLDTRTGETWVLQLAVGGTGDPTVKSAVWAKVKNSGIFYPGGPPEN